MDSSYHCFTLKVPATPSFLENNISQKKKKNGHTACSKGCVALQANFYFGLKKSAEKTNCIRPEMKIKLTSYGRISTSESASVVNHTGEI